MAVSFASFGQGPVTESKAKNNVYSYVEVMPKASVDIVTYLSENLHYPIEARKKNIQGKVMVRFIVNEDGSITDCEVIRGIGGGCDEEAVRAISAMPKWKPGMTKGKPVKVYFTQPISFKLN